MMNLYFNPIVKKYYYNGDPHCFDCGSELNDVSFFVKITHTVTHTVERNNVKKKVKFLQADGKILCHHCLDKVKDLPLIIVAVDAFRVILTNIVPSSAFEVIVKPDSALNDAKDLSGTLTTWAATDNKGINADTSRVATKDSTKLSYKESWEGSQIGLPPPEQNPNASLVDCMWADDKKLDVDEVDAFLLGQKDSVPELDDVRTKRLGVK